MRLTPRSFLMRTILMVLVPLVVSLMIVANAFFGNHWKRVHETLANTLAGEITTMLHFIDRGDDASVKMLAQDIGINVTINDSLNRPKHNDNKSMEAGILANKIQNKTNKKVVC